VVHPPGAASGRSGEHLVLPHRGALEKDALAAHDRLRLGIHFVYEPGFFDPATGVPRSWSLLRGTRESQVFKEINRALNHLQGFLKSDSLAPDTGSTPY
jgi:hypothetical protein